MKRRLVTLAAATSLLLCIVTVVLWIRSYWRYDEAGRYETRDDTYRTWTVRSVLGELDYRQSHSGPYEPALEPERGWSYASDLVSPTQTLKAAQALPGRSGTSRFLGFGFVHNEIWGDRVIAIPHWFIVLLFAILPALRLRAAIRSRRHGLAGLCPTCSYDLRATPDRCPECGSSIA